jgi:predicted dehydrogenase
MIDSVYGKSSEIQFVAVSTRHPANIADYCAQHGIRMFTSYEQLLADPDIDGVVIATPNSLHESQIIAAANAGKHVYVEKPFTLTLAAAHNAVTAVQRAGVTLAVGLNRRFHPNMLELTRRVRAGELGVVSSMIADLTAATGFHRLASSWRTQAAEEPAGAMVSIGVHLVDAMINMAGPVGEVYCVAANRGGPHGHDTTHLMLQFTNGASGMIYCSVAATRHHRMAVYGTKAFAEVAGPQMNTLRVIPIVEGRVSHMAKPPEPEVFEYPSYNYVGESLDEFARCIRDKKPYPITPKDILHGVAVLDAAIRSTNERKPVQLPD